MLNCDPPRQGVIVLRPLRRIKFGPPLNCDTQVLIPRWIMTPGLDSTLNVDPESWFNIKLWPGIGITIQSWIMTRGHDSTWNFDPGSYFNVELWPWVIIPRWNVIPGHDSTLNCYPGQDSTLKFNPGSWFHVEKLPRVLIQHWNMTLGLNSTLNCDPESWFNVELWHGLGITIQCGILTRVIIQRGILTRGQYSTWNFDPGSQFNVEFWPVYISFTHGIATQDGVKIQQRDQNSTAKEGHNSTKNPLNIDPGSVFNRGVKILSYTSWVAYHFHCEVLFRLMLDFQKT